MAEVRMPKMGDGMEQGTINAWLKKEGDAVVSGESIAEVETDKANVEIAAYESGVLSKIIVQVGQTVPVGDVIAMIGGGKPTTKLTNGATPSADVKSRPAAAANLPASAPASVTTPEPPTVTTENTAGPERIKASPLARRMAAEMGIDLAVVSGTGPGGRVVERDIEKYQLTAPAQPNQLLRPAAGPGTTDPKQLLRPLADRPTTGLAGQDIKPTKMREAIARRVLQSKQTIPHFYVTMVIEMDRAVALLKELNADTADSKVTVNDVIVKACAVALTRVPEVNATWTPDGLVRRYAGAHIGVAVGITDGLIIPVIRDCQSKTLRQISADAKSLIGKARSNQLMPDEYSGGTFSISNLGMMGVDEFIAIINPPEAAILAIGGIVREPVVVDETDATSIRSRMKVTLSADHRVLDGVLAARFLQEVKAALEAPFSLVV